MAGLLLPEGSYAFSPIDMTLPFFLDDRYFMSAMFAKFAGPDGSWSQIMLVKKIAAALPSPKSPVLCK
jgi:hypothetical protein